MNSNKITHVVLLLVVLIGLFALPLFVDLYYQTFYYIGSIIVSILAIYRMIKYQKLEERFYQKWREQSKQGFWINVIRLGLRSFVIMTIVIFISQLVAYGRTPLQIFAQLSVGAMVWFLIVLFLFSLITGVAGWFDNQKRFNRIYYNKQK